MLIPVLLTVVAANADACDERCDQDLGCWLRLTDCLLSNDRARDAIDLLKRAQQAGTPGMSLLLARAYLGHGNSVWAQRTLQANVADCTSRSWLAWLHITQGNLGLARETLHQPGCPETDEETARWNLLAAYIARLDNDHEAAIAGVNAASDAPVALPEDLALLAELRAREDPAWIDPVGIRLQLSTGYTTNALAGSPTDPTQRDLQSGLVRVDAFGRFVVPASGILRPFFEGVIKGNGLHHRDVKRLSYLELSVRPGLLVWRSRPRAALAYRGDLLLLNSRAKREFYEGHRAELDVEINETFTAFAGGGRRLFVEGGRTRWEVDGGVGVSLPLGRRVHLLAAAALRSYDAVGEPYDQIGATALLSTRVHLPRAAFFRLGATLGWDSYHASGGELGRIAFGTAMKRSDLLAKLTARIWSPTWSGARVGLRYDLIRRDSSADRQSGVQEYDYLEHRTTMGVRWVFDLDPFAPSASAPDGHIPLDYGLGTEEASLEEERIQDLLRQDEAARRGSSCVE